MKKYFFILVVSFIGLSSCDKIGDPYEGIDKVIDPSGPIDTSGPIVFCGFEEYDFELNDTNYNDTTSNIRKVLLEEFTGHLCGFCPPASKKLVEQSENDFKGKAILVSIHAGGFAAMTSKYTTDYTTRAGNDLWENYEGQTAPILMMNRSNFPASAPRWDNMLDSLNNSGFYDNPIVKFKVRNISNTTIKKGRADIDVEFLKDFSGVNFVLGVYITEDNIIGKQKWYQNPNGPEDVPDYFHRHVLRTNVTPTFGVSFVSGTVSVNQKESRSFCYDIQDEWNPDNCSVIIFLGNADNNQIFQAEEVHVKSE